MKSMKILGSALVCGALFFSCENETFNQDDPNLLIKSEQSALKGNGAPTGAHYNLNIIGMSKEKTADMTNNNGHRIFVNLEGNTKIKLAEGDTYQVLDANGTDRDGASFQLPNPDPDGDGTTTYSIWARALGKPGGSATITTCAEYDDGTGVYVEVCSAESLEVERTRGRQRFVDVSKDLLTIVIEEDILAEDGVTVLVDAGRYTIFDDALENYFWSYDNNGLRLLQLRFYEVPSNIAD